MSIKKYFLEVIKISFLNNIKALHQYSAIPTEIYACRKNAALFDFSFVSSASIYGADSLAILSKITKRDFRRMNIGDIKYALSCDENGWIRSDITIWKETKNRYLLMSGLPNDINDLISFQNPKLDCKVKKISKKIKIYSVQGPNSFSILSKFLNQTKLKSLAYFNFLKLDVFGIPCLIGRLGYTGELGFEIILPAEHQSILWEKLVSKIRPCGLIAINQLRIEAGFVFFDNEFRLPVSATDLGLESFSNNNVESQNLCLISFQGKTAQKLELWSPLRTLKMPKIGEIIITSACKQLNSRECLGLGFVKNCNISDNQSYTDPYGKFWNIRKVPRPFYDTLKRRPRIKLY